MSNSIPNVVSGMPAMVGCRNEACPTSETAITIAVKDYCGLPGRAYHFDEKFFWIFVLDIKPDEFNIVCRLNRTSISRRKINMRTGVAGITTYVTVK